MVSSLLRLFTLCLQENVILARNIHFSQHSVWTVSFRMLKLSHSVNNVRSELYVQLLSILLRVLLTTDTRLSVNEACINGYTNRLVPHPHSSTSPGQLCKSISFWLLFFSRITVRQTSLLRRCKSVNCSVCVRACVMKFVQAEMRYKLRTIACMHLGFTLVLDKQASQTNIIRWKCVAVRPSRVIHIWRCTAIHVHRHSSRLHFAACVFSSLVCAPTMSLMVLMVSHRFLYVVSLFLSPPST